MLVWDLKTIWLVNIFCGILKHNMKKPNLDLYLNDDIKEEKLSPMLISTIVSGFCLLCGKDMYPWISNSHSSVTMWGGKYCEGFEPTRNLFLYLLVYIIYITTRNLEPFIIFTAFNQSILIYSCYSFPQVTFFIYVFYYFLRSDFIFKV